MVRSLLVLVLVMVGVGGGWWGVRDWEEPSPLGMRGIIPIALGLWALIVAALIAVAWQ
jgi:cadmium resistance protein CadD (predicted permease)